MLLEILNPVYTLHIKIQNLEEKKMFFWRAGINLNKSQPSSENPAMIETRKPSVIYQQHYFFSYFINVIPSDIYNCRCDELHLSAFFSFFSFLPAYSPRINPQSGFLLSLFPSQNIALLQPSCLRF